MKIEADCKIVVEQKEKHIEYLEEIKRINMERN